MTLTHFAHYKARITADGSKAKKTVGDVSASLKRLAGMKAGPCIIVPSDAAKKRADATTAAFKTTGKQRPKPTIGTPSDAAKKRAEATTKALRQTGATHAGPTIKAPSDAAKRVADSATSALRTTGRQHPTPKITVSSNAASVAHAAQRYINAVKGKTVTITTKHVSNSGQGTGGGRAEGGLIGGWSPNPKADNIPIMATAREFMQPVASGDYYGTRVRELMRTRSIPRSVFSAMGFADGGQVGASPTSSLLRPASTVIYQAQGPAQAAFRGDQLERILRVQAGPSNPIVYNGPIQVADPNEFMRKQDAAIHRRELLNPNWSR